MVIDTSNLNEQDFDFLKNQDPFLYYSIPAVRQAEVVHIRDIDVSDIQVQGKGSHKVERQSRISFECPMDVLMDDMMEDMKGPWGVNDLDPILHMFLEDERPLDIDLDVSIGVELSRTHSNCKEVV
mmetsp:Transcript_10310/g.15290  ORF Transcript_10310/g.15290 Transcript_10310/m.15290 type:complete len:126 (+) Transcript_10310:125-502(+)